MTTSTDGALRQSVFVVPTLVQVAHRRGLFNQVGVDVATDPVPSSVAQRDDLLAGRCDVAITAIDNLFAWNAAGADITLIAQIETSTRLILGLRPGLDDLSGQAPIRLGVDAPNNGFAVVLRAFMAHRGVSVDRYSLVEIGGVRERLEALAQGDVDATLLSPPLDAVAATRGMALTGPTLAEVAPGYPGLGVVSPRSLIEAKRLQIIGYLTSLRRAIDLVGATTDGVVAQWLSDYGDDDGAVAAMRETLPTSLAPDPHGLQVLAEMREQFDMRVPGAPGPGDLVDLSVVAAAEAAAHRFAVTSARDRAC